MGRKIRPLIYIFCEGDSEIVYADCIKKYFSDVAVIKKPVKGLFSTAMDKFEKDAKYRNNAEVTDEIWFFFDVDRGQLADWDVNYKVIKQLRKLRKPKIRIRLLMTTGCVEYWFLLHYEKTRPSIQSVAEKERVEARLKRLCPNYFKGDSVTANTIFKQMDTAVANGIWSLKNVDNLPTLEDSDRRNQWLYQSTVTFTTVHEAIQFLESLQH